MYCYNKRNLFGYTSKVITEMQKRKIEIKNWENYDSYFKGFSKDYNFDDYVHQNPFPKHHTKQYLLQCFMNLEEKYFCGQKDFNRATYLKLWNFVNNELNGLLQEISKELKEE